VFGFVGDAVGVGELQVGRDDDLDFGAQAVPDPRLRRRGGQRGPPLVGLVQARPEGRRRIYAVRNGHVRRLVTETLAHADHLLSGLPDHE
jgi:hypothetical protein